jgi:hypothetical protein
MPKPIAVATIAGRRSGLSTTVPSSRTAEAGDPVEREGDDATPALERDFMRLFSAGAERPCNQTLT